MPILYESLLRQHPRQLNPVGCARTTIAQLHRYFEDVVLENNLNALVIESLPATGKPSPREKVRIRELAKINRSTFFLVNDPDAYQDITQLGTPAERLPVFLQDHNGKTADEHFVIVADTRFSALLATVRPRDTLAASDDVIWTFEPDVVYSALEFMMARIAAEHSYQSELFEAAVRRSMPKATSLQLTLGVTTKLAHLLQEQAGREIAVNRIATAIRESLELGAVLQKTVDEVATALAVPYCALRLEAHADQEPLTYFHLRDDCHEESLQHQRPVDEFQAYDNIIAKDSQVVTRDCDHGDARAPKLPLAIVPLFFRERKLGALLVISDDRKRVWDENELLLLRTVSDQVAVAVNQARLFTQIQEQAMTDPLTGCRNRRAFEMQLDHDLQMARRLHQPLSLLMLDIDRFKELNDSVGHDAGDEALRKLTATFRQELRNVDSAARFGGDEFVIILPQADSEGALLVAQRLHARINDIDIQGFGKLNVSIGIAAFPAGARSRAELVTAADGALYAAKRAGRNRVCTATTAPESLEEAPAAVISNQGREAPLESVM
jgi:diguanylate cyclase (GGDEF)-like protein